MGMMGGLSRYLGLSAPAPAEEAEDTGRPGRHEVPRPVDGAVVGAGLSFRGEVSGEGDFHIAGKFEGDISVTGRVLVSEGAQVDANINALAIVIGGAVRGNLSATTRVEILPTGVLTGTLKTGSFLAADGSSVKGEIWVERAGGRAAGPEPGA